HYTIGQRRGVNIGGKSGESGRWFVVKKDLKNNVLYVSHGDESPLYSDGCLVTGLNWIGGDPPVSSFECTAKFRYRQGEQKVTVEPTAGGVKVIFAEKQRAVTEGQYAVFYDKTRCLGGGVIESVKY
ncbi:MAG: tRNA 2-thiouridine(34) synthase MnmA, partial [Clostridia bacterium]|nr:tRNA 2-thiouridine(34) synthase MnmA [Clostridia bacterium]